MKKDNDIREMFNSAIQSDADANVRSDKIKNSVMERLGKQARNNLKLSESGETVEPVFVTASPRKSRKAPAIIAAATAACLGVVTFNTGFFGLAGGGLVPLSSNPESAQEEATNTEETTVTEETTALDFETQTQPYENVLTSDIEDKDPLQYEDGEEAAPILLKSDKFTLLDGTKITIENNNIISDTDMGEAIWLLTGDGGRVYFYGNGGKEEDITDIISTGEPYVTSYENDKSGATHYIAAGGNPAARSYGYAEIFKVREGEWHYQLVHTTTPDPMSKEKPDWLQKAFKELTKDSEECVFRGGAQYVDLDNVLSPTDFTAMKNDFRYGEIYVKKHTALFDSLTPTDTTTLYDGSILKEYTDDKGVTVTLLDRRNAADILTLENGRLFLSLNGEKTDITNKISKEEPYIVKAENLYTNSAHYIAIGGEPKENGWGCVEIYKNGQQYYIPLNGYYFRGENWFKNISDNLPPDLTNCETSPQVPDYIFDKEPTE